MGMILIIAAMAPMMTKSTIIIADDHSIVRRGIINIFKENWGITNILQAETFQQVLQYLQKPADLLILDINMPGGNNTRMLDAIRSD